MWDCNVYKPLVSILYSLIYLIAQLFRKVGDWINESIY